MCHILRFFVKPLIGGQKHAGTGLRQLKNRRGGNSLYGCGLNLLIFQKLLTNIVDKPLGFGDRGNLQALVDPLGTGVISRQGQGQAKIKLFQ